MDLSARQIALARQNVPQARFMHADMAALDLPPETLEAIAAYDWPGNVRELGNAIERGVILCDDGVLTPELLAIDHRAPSAGAPPEGAVPGVSSPPPPVPVPGSLPSAPLPLPPDEVGGGSSRSGMDAPLRQ
mgnify:CR=1 FL=1